MNDLRSQYKWLNIWLQVIIFLHILRVFSMPTIYWRYLIESYPNSPVWASWSYFIISFTRIIFASAILKWKKWGFWGYLSTFILLSIIYLYCSDLIKLSADFIIIFILFLLLFTKGEQKAWDNLR